MMLDMLLLYGDRVYSPLSLLFETRPPAQDVAKVESSVGGERGFFNLVKEYMPLLHFAIVLTLVFTGLYNLCQRQKKRIVVLPVKKTKK